MIVAERSNNFLIIGFENVLRELACVETFVVHCQRKKKSQDILRTVDLMFPFIRNCRCVFNVDMYQIELV